MLAPNSGSWSSLSDSNIKADHREVNPLKILEAVGSLSISTWRYDGQDVSVRHIGPTAQDFYAAFGVGQRR